jgi:hypothetical protein
MLFTAHQYTVTDTDITPTGKTEVYVQETREAAIAACLYTHKLHNGNAVASKNGVIHCPTCGQMAVVNTPTEREIVEQAVIDNTSQERAKATA